MSDTNGLVNVVKVIEDYMLQSHTDRSQRARISAIALQGVRDLNMFRIDNSKIEEIPMTAINTVNLPDDFLKLVSIGIPFNGKMWFFTRKDDIIKTTSFIGGAEVLDPNDGEGVDLGKYNQFLGYGTRGGVNQYYYTVDEPNRRIIINGFPQTKVILIYISSGISLSNGVFIPQYAYNSLFAWIAYKDVMFNPNVSGLDKQMREENYYTETRKLARFRIPTIEEIRDTLYSTYVQTVKRA